MDKNISRRTVLKGLSAAATVPLISAPPTRRKSAPGEPAGLVHLQSKSMAVAFDRQTGTIYSIQKAGDPFRTNFLGNAGNTRGVQLGDVEWTGHIVTAVWTPRERAAGETELEPLGKWRKELTSKSADVRRVASGRGTFTVRYAGASQDPQGIRSCRVEMRYHFAQDGSLLWDLDIENVTGRLLEVGELALPFRANDDYSEIYKGMGPREAIEAGKMPELQRTIYEQKVLAHHFIGGHSSYAVLQRPRGDAPVLLFHATKEAAFECAYKVEGFRPWFDDDWIGTDLLALHSWATKQQRRWKNNPWVNGHTSLLLQPGEKKSYQFRFAFLDGYRDIRRELYEAGDLGIRILPAMVVQDDSDVHVEVKSKSGLDRVEAHSDGIRVKERKQVGDATLLTLSFTKMGQKTLRLVYGGGKWTNLHFYCVQDAERLLKSRGRFIVEREFYDNPSDPYHRHHGFLPFDDRRGMRVEDYDDVWEVGCSDEPGFSAPLFLVEKNVYYPSQEEVATLETYVSDCLFKYVQNPQTYAVRASLYWKDRHPSSPWGNWSKERSETTWRTYNYPHPANIYHALYRIGKQYGLLTQRTPQEYLRMSYRTCLQWFNTGPWKHIGLMGGSNALNILADLRHEGWEEEYTRLLAEIKKCCEEFVRDPYPYSSEIPIDATAQEQVYFFTRHFGSAERRDDTVRVLAALRGPQPAWFRYGIDLFAHPDLRGEVVCWYSSALNGMVLLRAFEDTGDIALLERGYPGLMSVLRNITPEGAGFGWFMVTPGIFAHEPPRTFENGPGLWGFLKAAKAYVVNDEAFGLIGLGCSLELTPHAITVYPRDGLKKRVRFVEEAIDIEAATGEIQAVTFDRTAKALEFRMADSSGIVKTIQMTISGLQSGDYRIGCGGREQHVRVSESLHVTVPWTPGEAITIRKA
ncbi:MAG: hypothetical protein LAN62_14215 [Acidobacteriia bacterium]|nr:hypothetical protein [Terriglobia bacterium]